jgi:hypothetical protein
MWEPTFDAWKEELDKGKFQYIFCTWKKSAEYFAKLYNNVFYLPHCMDDRIFKDYGMKKSILFMQMGRKNQTIHKLILDFQSILNFEMNKLAILAKKIYE